MPDMVEAFADLRAVLDWPDATSELTDRAVAQIRSHPARARRARWPFVVIGVVIAAGAGLPVAAHFLTSGGVRVEVTDESIPEGIATELDLGAPAAIRPNEARPRTLGNPSAAFAGRPRDAYTELWDEPNGGYVLITRFPGHVEDELIRKRVYDGGTLEEATVDGGVAYWIGGPHGFLYVDDSGKPAEDTLRLSGHALVWTREGITYRLESTSRSLEESIALAEAVD